MFYLRFLYKERYLLILQTCKLGDKRTDRTEHPACLVLFEIPKSTADDIVLLKRMRIYVPVAALGADKGFRWPRLAENVVLADAHLS